MLREITIGQYYPADSVLHRLDPRTKFVGTILYMTRFHESRRFAEICTLEGVTAVIAFDENEDEDIYCPYLINGIAQDEYFEYELLYAD